MNLLLDTNVVIDFMGRKDPHFAAAEQVIAAGYFGDAKLWMPAQSAKDSYYVLSRYIDQQRVQHALLDLFEIVTPVALTSEDLVQAARLAWPDYEDCLVAVSAAKARADYLITRDKKGFGRSMVPALSPSEWVDMMRCEKRLSYTSIDI